MSSPTDFEKATAALKRLMPGTARRIGADNLEWSIQLAASFEEIRGEVSLRAILGPHVGILMAAVLLLPMLMAWLFDFPGAVAGVVFSAALLFAWRRFRAVYTNTSIHLGGASGYQESQRLLAKHVEGGTEQHRISRAYPTYWTARFIYRDSEPPRLSWRAFGLPCLILIALIWFPLIGVAIVSLVLAFVSYAISAGRAPIALYLGPSTVDALKLFWRIRYGTGITWASLLKDPLDPSSEAGGSIEQAFDLQTNFVYSNPWSLRCDDNEDWLTIVRDFISASTVIVVKAADVSAVLLELDLLRASHPLERILVIADESFPIVLLPAELRPAAMTEADAMALLAQIASRPRAFRARMRERASLFSTTETRAVAA